MRRAILLLLAITALLSGCFYDNYTELYPAADISNGCDTVNAVTYSKQVASVMNGYCVNCHKEGTVNGNMILDHYDGVKNAALSGKLVGSIRHQSGHSAMPPNSQLDECSMREIEIWIENNYPQ